MPHPPAIRRLFWGWDAPVLDQAVAYLTQGWQPQQGALDLSDTLVVVPTSEAGRRLKQAIAQATSAHDQGASVPWVWSPEQALTAAPLTWGAPAATRLQAQVAWQQALDQVPLDTLRHLFPSLPEQRGWSWQVEMARLLAELKSLLGAAGLTFGDAAQSLPQDCARWGDLALLEQAYLAQLDAVALLDSQALKLRLSREPRLPPDVRQVIVLPSPDLPPLLSAWIQGCTKIGVPVEVAIHAPASQSHAFDQTGRPLISHWGEDADMALPIAEGAIHLRHDAAAQATTVIQLLREIAPVGHVALGVADPEVGAILQEKLALEQVNVFEPGGVPVQEVGLWHVLSNFRTLLASESWRSFSILLRVPEVRQTLSLTTEGGFGILELADDLAATHLPVTLAHAQELLERMLELESKREVKPLRAEAFSRLRTALQESRNLLQAMKRLPLAESARMLLVRLYGERLFRPEAPGDHLTTELADRWLQLAADVEIEASRFKLQLRAEDALDLSLEMLAQERLAEPRGDIDLVLQGWLELLWESAPNLLVAGLNEEFVPGIAMAHPFLPDQVRQALGLPCQATRFARDAYLLHALAEQRLGGGRLELLCGQWSERGDALRPSRTLFLCPDEALPRRVGHLFPKDENGSAESEPPRTVAWKLRPKFSKPKVETISPSRIRSYLQCPFRDYLSHELRMEATEPRKRELGPGEFGSLTHFAFQSLAEDAAMRDCEDAAAIEEFLTEAALRHAQRIYGNKPAPLVNLQMESLKQRLRHAAAEEAAQRRAGWRVLHSEIQLGGPDDATPLLIEGARLRCTIDRIERRDDGRIRVLDFKTTDKSQDPQSAHAGKVSGRKVILEQDEWKCFDLAAGGRLQWRDVQLPLYAAALRLRGLTPDEVGYFALPKSVMETEIRTWTDFSNEWIDHALECAAEVVRRLRAGFFWPPADRAYARSFDELFLGDPHATVEPPDLEAALR